MKVERTRQLQSQRVDRQKANVPRIVQQIPNSGRQGDTVIIESTNEQYIFDRGTWRGVGVSREATEEIAEEAVANAPRAARVDNVDSIVLVLNQEAIIFKQYEQGNPLRDTFVFKNFATRQDAEDDNELPVNERPINISFDPPTPVQREGTHLVAVTFTPQRAGNAIAEVYLE